MQGAAPTVRADGFADGGLQMLNGRGRIKRNEHGVALVSVGLERGQHTAPGLVEQVGLEDPPGFGEQVGQGADVVQNLRGCIRCQPAHADLDHVGKGVQCLYESLYGFAIAAPAPLAYGCLE